MKVYTCTPKNFPADEDSFFSRESGLFCRALQSLGFDSKSVLLLPKYPQDGLGVLRGTYQELCDPVWWRALQLDGLILYSWAAPQYNAVAMAVHQAGIPAVVYMDTCGLVSRLGNRKGWWCHAWRPSWAKSGNIALRIYSLTKFFIDTALLITPRRRLRHLACGHAITLPTRSGVIWMKREVSLLGRPDLVDKIHYSPHPQKELFRYDGTHKENVVLCVARFLREDWPQKRPALLIQSLNAFLAKNHDWRAVVVGRGASTLANNLGLHAHAAIRFEENLAHRDLVGLYQKAKIGFWTSLWEGQQGTAAQSLCCGCSVVAPSSPLNSCFEDYVSQSSGRLATDSSVTCLTEALSLEAQEWAQGFRLPDKISLFWSSLLHGRQRASAVLKLLDIPLPENP